VAAGQHAHRAERSNRMIKDSARAILSSLACTLPGRLIPHLLTFVVQRLNQLPRESIGLVAPNELFTGRRFDYKRDGRSPFGAFVIAPEPETDNSMMERARACIVLCAKHNLSGNWLLWDIRHQKVISRAEWKEHPITADVIERVNKVAAHDLQFLDKTAFESEEWHMARLDAPSTLRPEYLSLASGECWDRRPPTLWPRPSR
jgi:hypothetical protein